MKKENIGSSFDSFLEDEGIKEEVELRAQKAVIARRVAAGLARSKMTQTQLATAMDTSRTVVHRLLDPTDTSVTLATLSRASKALGVALLRVADSDVPELPAAASVNSAMGRRESVLQVSEPAKSDLRKRTSGGRSPSPHKEDKKPATETPGRRSSRGKGPGLASTRQTPPIARADRKSKQRALKHANSR